MTPDDRRTLAERVLAASRADATEVIVTSTHRALTRFTHEFVHQNVDVDDVSVRVRAIVDGRSGVASSNASDESSLAAVAARARELATFAPREDNAPAVAGTATVTTPPGAYDDATAENMPDWRARVAERVFAHARENDCWSAGYVTASTLGVTIATSAGARLAFDGTEGAANVKMTAADSTGFAERYATNAGAIDGDVIGARAARKARDSANPIAVDPGDWTVILEPAAFGELLPYLGSHFSAQSYDEGSSFLTGRLGEAVLGSNVTIRDDYAHPLHPGMPFDWEGSPKSSMILVERGVAGDVVTDRTWAARLKRPNTGHGLPAPNAYGPHPGNLVVEPGTASLEELIAGTKRGLLVTRLWYVRIVDQRRVILTGMTRDGTFLIENGRLTGGVNNMRFNQSLVEALRDCTFASEAHRTGGYSYSLVTPAVKFERFTFASSTEY